MTNPTTLVKCILIFLAELEMLCFSGMLYGLNAIFPIFTDLHFFCNSRNVSNPCSEQKYQLGFLFITTIISNSMFSIPLGLYFDRFGFYKTKLLCAVVALVGFLSFSLSTFLNQYLAFVACVFLGVFSQAVSMSNYAVASIFPNHQHAIISVFSCSYDISAIMMTFIWLSYEAGVHIKWSFLFLAGLGTTLSCTTAALSEILEKFRNILVEEVSFKDNDEHRSLEKEFPMSQNVNLYLERKIEGECSSLRNVLLNRFFVIEVVNYSIINFSLNFFFAELYMQLNNLFPLNQSLVNSLLQNINYIFTSAILFSPIPGLVIKFLKQKNEKSLIFCAEEKLYAQFLLPFLPSFFFCTVTNQLMLALVLIPSQGAVYCAFVIVMLMRMTFFTTHTLFLLNAFPKRYFGMLFGITISVSGTLCFVHFAILFEDESRLFGVNVSIIVLLSVTYFQPILWFMNNRNCSFCSNY